MKRFIIYLLALCPILFFACSKKEPRAPSSIEMWMENNGKVKVLSTTAMIDDLVMRIGGEYIDHISLIVGDLDPHTYELVKGDEEKFTCAHVVFGNGLGLEHGASVHYHLHKHPHAIFLGDVIEKKHPGAILQKKGQKDPHVWMDVSLWAEAIEPIVRTLSEVDPQHAPLYLENGKTMFQEMQETHKRIQEKLRKIPSEKRFLVTSHDAFNYFARSYLSEESEKEEGWQDRFVAPEGLAPDGQLGARDIQKVIDYLYAHQVHVLFPETNVSRDSLKKIVSSCKELGLDVTISKDPLYGDAMGSKGSDADSYMKMIEHNASVLVSAWEK